MASYKDIFEPKIFAANMFASGTWRGKGLGLTAAEFYVSAGEIFKAGHVTGDVFNPGKSEGEVFIPGRTAGSVIQQL